MEKQKDKKWLALIVPIVVILVMLLCLYLFNHDNWLYLVEQIKNIF